MRRGALNLRWLIFDHVPPGIKLTPQQRRGFRRKVKDADVSISWKNELLAFLISLPLIFGWIFLLFLIGLVIPLNVARFPLMIAGSWVIVTALSWRYARGATFAALREMGYDVCLNCGYWLRGLGDEVNQCPECGWGRETEA